MWLLNILPDFIIHLSVVAGVLGLVASFFLGFIPFVLQYKLPIQVISIIVLVFGIYFEGGIANENVWKLRVAEAQQQAIESKAQAEVANRKLTETLSKRDKDIREATNNNLYKLRELSNQINKQCVVDNSVVSLLNNAAANRKENVK